MIKKIFIIFWLLIINSTTFAVNVNVKKVVKHYLTDHFLNATFMFADNEKILTYGAKGVFSVSDANQLQAIQQMPIASATKPITAAAILRLQDKQLLNVNDKISKYIDADLWGDNIPTWANEVSIHNLLTNSSGIAEYFGSVKVSLDMSQQDINKAILGFISSKPLEFNIGEKYKYSNTNYFLLGIIIEKISGKNLATFLSEEFFKPLSMKMTHLATFDEAVKIQENTGKYYFPVRYYIEPNDTLKPKFTLVTTKFTLVPYSDGGLISNTADLVKWYRALNGGKLLSDESYKLMITKYFLKDDSKLLKTYTGYGVFITELENNETMIHHPGSAVGIRSEAGFIATKNIYFAILSNVMVNFPMATKDQNINYNQLDISFFRDAIIRMIISQQ